MRGVELTGIDMVIGFFAIFLVIASFPLRVWLFHKLKGDSSVKDLFDGASMIGSDLLPFRLIRSWRTISIAARGPVLAFVLTQLSGLFLLLVVWVRALL